MVVLYKALISDELRKDILEYYSMHCDLPYVSGSSLFPCRPKLDSISTELEQRLARELTVTLSGYFTEFSANLRNIRIYESHYGIVKPHIDIAVYPEDTHTCLIYLTDEFDGGILTVKAKRDQNHILSHGESHKKHLCVTPEPRVTYGIVFPKGVIHYTNELLEGRKVILLIDCHCV